MRLLTVRQPWASAFFIGAGAKDIENRRWGPSGPGRIGIHAGRIVARAAMVALADLPPVHDRDYGVVLGTVEVVSWHRERTDGCREHRCQSNRWAMWSDTPESRPIYHWCITQPRAFVTPIPARGALGLWNPGPSVEHLMSIADVVERIPR